MSRVQRSRVVRVTVAAAIAVLVVGCSGSTDSSTPPAAAPSEAVDEGTPLEDVDTTSLVVPREPFCDRVDPGAVARALGEEPADVSAYRSGQHIRINDNIADVVHEFGCRWTAGDGTAEAWVFVPPVTRKRATDLVRDGCRGVDGPPFGEPSVACRTRAAGGETFTFRGLFGDAWLSCRLTLGAAGRDEMQERADRWCAAVATGASTAG